MSPFSTSCRTTRHGAAATELAIVTPLIILLALAAADLGRAFYVREGISNAARVGATMAASRGVTNYTRTAWEASVRDAVCAELENLPNFNEADLELAIAVVVVDDSSGLFRATVELAYPFRTAVAWPSLPHELVIRERVAMQRFR